MTHRHLRFLAFSGWISPISPCLCKWLSNVIFPNARPAKTSHALSPVPALLCKECLAPHKLEVCRLKVVKANETEVRQALRSQGYTRTRVSQLWAECLQSPPRSWAQRELQSAQDQPQCNHDASKELNSTNDAPSIIYPDSIIDCLSK